jgi:hypothetical protein
MNAQIKKTKKVAFVGNKSDRYINFIMKTGMVL